MIATICFWSTRRLCLIIWSRAGRDLFNISFDVLLYDLTSTYFEIDPPLSDEDKRQHGYSREHRPDCVQVVIALVVTPQGFPLAYEVLAGNTADNTTLKDFLARIERQYGKAQRTWLMDRGIPTEEELKQMRTSEPPVQYLVGTPKGRLSALEQALLVKPWKQVRPEVRVKLLPQEAELYVFAESRDRIAKERSMRRRQMKWLWARLKKLATMKLTRDALLMKLGAAQNKTPAAWRLVSIQIAVDGASFGFWLNRKKLREVRRREGRYLLRTNLTRVGSREAVGVLPAVGVCRGGLQDAQRRSGHPPDLSSTHAAYRSAHLRLLPGVLSARDARTSTEALGSGA